MGSFEFFIAMASGGLLVFSIAYLWNVETLKPFTKIAVIGSLAAVVASGVAIFEDLGMPFHALYMLITPNVASPLFWDVIILTLFVIVSVVAVGMTLLPDTKKHIHDRGYRMTNEENCRRFSFIAFPMAFLVNIVTSFMFATQSTREWWHSALIPVNACAEAVAVGLSFTILLCIIMVKHEIFVENSDGIQLLSRIAAAAIAGYIAMSFIEIVSIAWNGTQESQHLLHLIFHTYGPLFWMEILLPLLGMILFIIGGGLGKELVGAASILVIIGIFIQRMMLLLPAFNSIPLTLPVAGKLWTFPIAVGTFTEGQDVFVRFWNYVPSLIEWAAGILPVGLIIFVMAGAGILFRLFPEE
jgi:molybdopterin-containing oxidoreductase family membrane subunit